jgi:hypothetical protein
MLNSSQRASFWPALRYESGNLRVALFLATEAVDGESISVELADAHGLPVVVRQTTVEYDRSPVVYPNGCTYAAARAHLVFDEPVQEDPSRVDAGTEP